MLIDVTIVDIGVGNAKSVQNMLRRLGVVASLTSSKEEIYEARRLILPGVGSFDRGVSALESFEGLKGALQEMVGDRKIPFLGICLGMQMIYDTSSEGSKCGLGWLRGNSKLISSSDGLPVPHMGWNNVHVSQTNRLVTDIQQSRFYFAHSYCVHPSDPNEVIGTVDYGERIVAMINKDNIFGVQFHPEKSHQFGMEFFRNFLRL